MPRIPLACLSTCEFAVEDGMHLQSTAPERLVHPQQHEDISSQCVMSPAQRQWSVGPAVSRYDIFHDFRWCYRPTLTSLKFLLSMLHVLGQLFPPMLNEATM